MIYFPLFQHRERGILMDYFETSVQSSTGKSFKNLCLNDILKFLDEKFYWNTVVGLTSSQYLIQEDGLGARQSWWMSQFQCFHTIFLSTQIGNARKLVLIWLAKQSCSTYQIDIQFQFFLWVSSYRRSKPVFETHRKTVFCTHIFPAFSPNFHGFCPESCQD